MSSDTREATLSDEEWVARQVETWVGWTPERVAQLARIFDEEPGTAIPRSS